MARLSRNVYALGLASLFTDVASEVTVRTIPFFLKNVLAVDNKLIGGIEGAAKAIPLIAQTISGVLSDRAGRRKPLTLAGYALSSLVKPLLYVVTSWPGVLVIRGLDRVGKGIRTAPRDALIADSVVPEERGRAFGLHRAMDTVGSVLGLLAVVLVVRARLGDSAYLDDPTFRSLALLASVPAVLTVLVLALLVKETEARGLEKKFSLEGALPPHLRRFLLAVFVFNLSAASDAFFLLRAQELGLALWKTMSLVLLMSVVQASISLPAGVVSDRLGRRGIVAIGWGVAGLQLVGFAFARSELELLGLFLLVGVFLGLTEGNEKALLTDLAPKELKGTAFSAYNGALGAALLAASAGMGALWDREGATVAFLAAGVMAFAGACLLAFVPPPTRAPARSA